jgi:hypothetical protein
MTDQPTQPVTLGELDSLLCVARRAASKLETMYMRGECARRQEVDELIRILPRLREAISNLRGGEVQT